jgi:hypothetical protein
VLLAVALESACVGQNGRKGVWEMDVGVVAGGQLWVIDVIVTEESALQSPSQDLLDLFRHILAHSKTHAQSHVVVGGSSTCNPALSRELINEASIVVRCVCMSS